MIELQNYPMSEKGLLIQLQILLKTWKEDLRKVLGNNTNPCDIFVCDGFLPYYTLQNLRILFLGWEAYGMADRDYIEMLLKGYHENRINDKTIAANNFHALLNLILYGITHRIEDFNDLPDVTSIAKIMGTEECSFAYMNFSKFSNESGKTNADWNLMKTFALSSQLTNKSYYQQEINLIRPDIIIGLNLRQNYKFIGEIDKNSKVNFDECVDLYKIVVGNKTYYLLDCYHFAARGKSRESVFYNPIIKALKFLNMF